jgi:hypothetical protein
MRRRCGGAASGNAGCRSPAMKKPDRQACPASLDSIAGSIFSLRRAAR